MSREILRHDNTEPTPQEELMLKLGHGAFDAAILHIATELSKGRSPSVLSVARPDIAVGFAEAFRSSDINATAPVADDYKAAHFDNYADRAATGDLGAIEALPKFTTSLAQVAFYADLLLSNREALTERRTDRPFLQYLGTFDPQHIGHRIAVQSGLITAGEESSAILHVMAQHPRKKNFQSSYDQRFDESERRFYESSLLDNERITQVDIPGGVGLAAQYPLQMELLADFAGDDELRWLTGSDKLILDATAVRDASDSSVGRKAMSRFSDPKMHAYVVHRQSDDKNLLENDVDYVIDRFGTRITIVDEQPYDCAPASSSKVKQLRSDGRHAEADHMELYELQS